MAATSTIAAIGVTFFTQPTDEKVLKQFYTTVKPAGFWKKTAIATGHNPREPLDKLWKEIQAIFLTAFSLFMMLIGIGKLIIPAPGQWILTPWFFISAALAAVPLWWDKAFESDRINLNGPSTEAK
jgi:solute:Na+ symporter, SSS family